MTENTFTDLKHPNSASERYHIIRVNHNIWHHSKHCLYALIAVGDHHFKYTCNNYINSFSRTKTYEFFKRKRIINNFHSRLTIILVFYQYNVSWISYCTWMFYNVLFIYISDHIFCRRCGTLVLLILTILLVILVHMFYNYSVYWTFHITGYNLHRLQCIYPVHSF